MGLAEVEHSLLQLFVVAGDNGLLTSLGFGSLRDHERGALDGGNPDEEEVPATYGVLVGVFSRNCPQDGRLGGGLPTSQRARSSYPTKRQRTWVVNVS